jgi:small conductance mechanosensitive channel
MKPVKPEILYDKLYSWILTVGPRLLIAIVVLVLGIWFIRIFRNWLRHRMKKRELDESFQPFLISLIVTVLEVMLGLGIIQVLGIQMTIFTTLVGAIGVAAGLALSGTMQNFASGVLILILKPYKVGDNIVAQGQDGIVSSIQLFYTIVTTWDNRTVIIPNSKLSNEVIVNISKLGKRRLDVEMKFSYAYDFEKIKSVIEKSLRSSPLIESEPKPHIGVSVLDPDGFKIIVNGWVNAMEFEMSKYEIQKKLVEDIRDSGIKLPGMV